MFPPRQTLAKTAQECVLQTSLESPGALLAGILQTKTRPSPQASETLYRLTKRQDGSLVASSDSSSIQVRGGAVETYRNASGLGKDLSQAVRQAVRAAYDQCRDLTLFSPVLVRPGACCNPWLPCASALDSAADLPGVDQVFLSCVEFTGGRAFDVASRLVRGGADAASPPQVRVSVDGLALPRVRPALTSLALSKQGSPGDVLNERVAREFAGSPACDLIYLQLAFLNPSPSIYKKDSKSAPLPVRVHVVLPAFTDGDEHWLFHAGRPRPFAALPRLEAQAEDLREQARLEREVAREANGGGPGEGEGGEGGDSANDDADAPAGDENDGDAPLSIELTNKTAELQRTLGKLFISLFCAAATHFFTLPGSPAEESDAPALLSLAGHMKAAQKASSNMDEAMTASPSHVVTLAARCRSEMAILLYGPLFVRNCAFLTLAALPEYLAVGSEAFSAFLSALEGASRGLSLYKPRSARDDVVMADRLLYVGRYLELSSPLASLSSLGSVTFPAQALSRRAEELKAELAVLEAEERRDADALAGVLAENEDLALQIQAKRQTAAEVRARPIDDRVESLDELTRQLGEARAGLGQVEANIAKEQAALDADRANPDAVLDDLVSGAAASALLLRGLGMEDPARIETLQRGAIARRNREERLRNDLSVSTARSARELAAACEQNDVLREQVEAAEEQRRQRLAEVEAATRASAEAEAEAEAAEVAKLAEITESSAGPAGPAASAPLAAPSAPPAPPQAVRDDTELNQRVEDARAAAREEYSSRLRALHAKVAQLMSRAREDAARAAQTRRPQRTPETGRRTRLPRELPQIRDDEPEPAYRGTRRARHWDDESGSDDDLSDGDYRAGSGRRDRRGGDRYAGRGARGERDDRDERGYRDHRDDRDDSYY